MKNNECKNCQIQNVTHKAIFGTNLINGLCVPCANETKVNQNRVGELKAVAFMQKLRRGEIQTLPQL